jgi:hypothetical protein
MNWRALAWIVLSIAALSQCVQQWERRAVHPSDGVLAPSEPRQTELNGAPAIVLDRWTLTPRAKYEITARVLGREDYRFDAMAKLAPADLALGWGPMSDSRVLRSLKISQSARFYSWRPTTSTMRIAPEEVTRHSANTHVIPASPLIRQQLARLRSAGQVVHLTGLLVDGVRDDGATIRTSLTRDDSGAGACEVLLVQQIEVE